MSYVFAMPLKSIDVSDTCLKQVWGHTFPWSLGLGLGRNICNNLQLLSKLLRKILFHITKYCSNTAAYRTSEKSKFWTFWMNIAWSWCKKNITWTEESITVLNEFTHIKWIQTTSLPNYASTLNAAVDEAW